MWYVNSKSLLNEMHRQDNEVQTPRQKDQERTPESRHMEP